MIGDIGLLFVGGEVIANIPPWTQDIDLLSLFGGGVVTNVPLWTLTCSPSVL